MDKELYTQCQASLPETMRLWEEIVNIDTGSGDAAGLRRLAAILEAKLTVLGCDITRIPANTPDSEYSILATRAGTGKNSVLLMAHMDTVFPSGSAAQRPFTVKGDWAHGPGVADCKAGVVAILAILRFLRPEDCRRVTVLFNCDEEIGSGSSKAAIIAQSAAHDYVLSYEPGESGDKVAIARKGSARIKIETFGKNSHAGASPELGVNAMAELVWQLGRMLNLGDAAKKTTAVFTKMTSGDKLNVVPDHGEAWANVRVTQVEELDRIERDLQRLTSERLLPGSRVEATLIRNRQPFPENEATNRLAHMAQRIYGELGLTLGTASVGGVGDINFAYGQGGACLCKLAPPNGGALHGPEETCYVPAMAPRIYLSVRLVRELCAGQRAAPSTSPL